MEPYLDGEARRLFDAWHDGLRRRHERDLTFAEIRKGVQALSSLYVARRGRLTDGAAALEGAGKRAAFALYYAPLHFLVTWHVVREIGFDSLPVARLWDLGCGTGASGAAWGTALRLPPEGRADPQRARVADLPTGAAEDGARDVPVGSATERQDAARAAPSRAFRIVGVDRSGFVLDEASSTYRAFGLRGETARIDLGGDAGRDAPIVRIGGSRGSPGRARRDRGGRAPALREDDAVLLAFTLNEMAEAGRETLLHEVGAGAGTSRPLLVIEPISKRAAPWWSRWERALGEEALVLHALEWRRRIELPDWIAEMDRAAGLDHGELTARVLGVIG